jgi:AcrR family transcriptional regulator
MEACVECLIEYGWAGTTTTVVAERAGVSRGAQLHHYPTRAELVVAAVEHVGRARAEEILQAASAVPPGPGRTEAVLTVFADFFTGPLFVAALELWVAARTDEPLRAVVGPLETRIGREIYTRTVELLGLEESTPGVREAVQATIEFIHGLGLASLLNDDRTRRARLIRQWATMLDATLQPPG